MPTAADAKINITAVDKTKQAFASVNSSLGGLKKAVFSARTALAGLTGGAVFKSLDAFGKSALAANAAFLGFSKRLGATAGGLSELAVAGDLAGVSMSQVNLAVQRATRRVGEAAQGYGEARKALDALNISAQELTNLPADKQFDRLADALLGVENQAERLTLAFKLFDSEGMAVLQMLDRLEQARRLAQETGAVISSEEIIDMEQFREAVAETEAKWRSLQQAFISTGIPRTLEMLKQQAIGLAEVFTDLFSTVGKGIGAIAASMALAVQGEFRAALDVFNEYAAEVKDLWGPQAGAGGGGGGGGGIAGPDGGEKAKKNFIELTRAMREQQQLLKARLGGWELEYEIQKKIADVSERLSRDLWPAEIQHIRDVLTGSAELEARLDALNKKTEDGGKAAEELGLTFSSAFEDAITQASSLRDVLQGLLQDIIKIFVRTQITKPLAGALTTAFSGFSFAAGTNFAPGGLALVGEQGPEIVNLPRGSQVIPNHALGGMGLTINVDARGSTNPLETEQTVRRAINGAVAQIRNMKVRGALPEFI